MTHRIMLIPIGSGAGLTSISLGLVRALQQRGLKVNFFKPIAQPKQGDDLTDKSTRILRNMGFSKMATPLSTAYVEDLMGDDKKNELLEEIVGSFDKQAQDESIIIMEGLISTPDHPYAAKINRAICQALDAEIILVGAPKNLSLNQLNDKIEIVADNYGGHKGKRVIGCILNKTNEPLDVQGRLGTDIVDDGHNIKSGGIIKDLFKLPVFSKSFPLLGCITWNFELLAPRVQDVGRHMNAELINKGDYLHRRLRSVHLCAREIHNLTSVLKPGALLIISGDRNDIIVSACLATLNGTKIGALLLTGGYRPAPNILKLCDQALRTGLPIMLVQEDTWLTTSNLHNFNQEVPVDDEQRINKVMDHTATCIDDQWLSALSTKAIRVTRLSPPAFRHKLTRLAQLANKTIVLPEGDEPRTIKAAAICCERNIAKCILLAEPEEVYRIAKQQGIILPEGLSVQRPSDLYQKYVAPLIELRKHKAMTEVIAKEALQDKVVLGTMMLQQNHVDGLVSGAIDTTANTIRPALQLIKTAPNASLVSSVFFMLLPEQVLVYGDCAINPDPSAEQLADIAIQSAQSAALFGIEPRVAMISYSTGDSGTGADVEKVKTATKIAQQKRPDLLIDGPMQYDAAIMESVAAQKAPNSKVAGQATVFIFPDLNTGNTTYKAVQRSADLISIGPMLQGLAKPVNDLSRGALVDDIVYTIALTAIQANQTPPDHKQE
jgi:phosphate acetyltransferase